MYQVRQRPYNQSSDEDDNDEKLQSGKSMQSDIQKDVDPTSVSEDIDDLKEPDDEENNVSIVHSDGNNDDQKFIDFSMFKSKGNKCGGNDKEKGITSHCDALQRLGEALKAYAMLNSMEQGDDGRYDGDDDEIEPEIPTFSEFVGSEYRVQFLEDFNHFMSEHQYFGEEVKEEMIAKYELKPCNAMDCQLTMRHFGRRRVENRSVSKKGNVRSKFYRQKFDSLHFHIFHLEESGYRFRSQLPQNEGKEVTDESERKTGDELDDQKAIDRELAEAVSSINENKKKCDFGRFVGNGPNKFTLSVSAKTWLERLFEYVKSQGVPQGVINKAKIWILKEAYDSDAVSSDVNELTIQHKQSLMCLHIDHAALSKSICDFVEMTKVPTFSVGLRFIYWEKCKGYKFEEFAEDNSLFIDEKGAKFKDIKEELLESGFCKIFAFQVIDAKCTELMLCEKVRGMKASSMGTSRNPGYGIKKRDPIKRSHVECVVVYCDLTDLSTALSATFRHNFFGESTESAKERNRSYFHLSKGLREAVECFGKNGRDESGPFFCGMSALLLLNQFGIRLCGPTSTSKSRAVAIRFAGECGVVLRMNNDYPYLHFFDCVLFSQFPEEDERLFIGGRHPVMIKSVLVMGTAQNFARFFGVLSVFDCVVSGDWLYEEKMPQKKDHSKLNHLIQWCLGKLEDSAASFPDFVYQTFNCFRRSKTEILLDLYVMNKEYLKVYTQHIVHSLAKRGWNDDDVIGTEIDWNSLFGIFPNITKISIDCYEGDYGFNLCTILQKMRVEVFPEHPMLKSVVLKEIGYKGSDAFKAQEEQLREQVDPSVFNLSFEDDGWHSALSISRN